MGLEVHNDDIDQTCGRAQRRVDHRFMEVYGVALCSIARNCGGEFLILAG
ncbi:hypothetical protein AVEN_15044-1, partial [Araneus ventricosus]